MWPSKDYSPEVDCRSLFIGDRSKELIDAYAEVVNCFAKTKNAADVLERLKSSARISQFYEVYQKNGAVSVEMRDSVFRERSPLDGLDIRLKIYDAKNALSCPLPLNRVKAFGRLWPLLQEEHTKAEIESFVRAELPDDEAHWATQILVSLKRRGLIECGPPHPPARFGPRSCPSITFMGHTSLLLQSERSAVLTDPLLRAGSDLVRSAFDVTRVKLGAICCTHSHWDHCNFQTLIRFDKSIPIIIPRVERPTVFNPPIADMLQSLGFKGIREVKLWEPVWIDDIELIPIPFYGEQDEPGAEVDHYTYVLRTKGLTLYGGVDCFRDSFGEMGPVLKEVERRYKPDVAFLPVSKMVYRYQYGGVNDFCRYLDEGLLEKSFQYTAGPEDAAEWTEILKAKAVVPYATFSLSRWATPPTVVQFERELRLRGLEKRLYPMRPLDSLTIPDLNGTWSYTARRRALVIWLRVGAFLTSCSRRIRANRVYTLLRRLM